MANFDASTPSLQYDTYGHRGRGILLAFHEQLRQGGVELPPQPFPKPPAEVVEESSARKGRPQQLPVGILGGGPGGLYTALILDDLGIPYRILEAQDDVGGRLFTYKFRNDTGAPYNYYDVGAMRFPQITSMQRVFHLFQYPPLNTRGIALAAKVKPYYFTCDNALLSYNDITVKQGDAQGQTFQASSVLQNVRYRERYIAIGTKDIVDDVINPFVVRLLKDLETGSDDGWKYLQGYDMHSTRSYMSTVYKPSKKLLDRGMPNQYLPTDIVNWCETFDKSTGWYDRSLAETVLEAIAFGYNPVPNPPETKWFCIDGGANQIAQCMATYIRSRQKDAITLRSRVTSIGLDVNGQSMRVTTEDPIHVEDSYNFSHVISTIPLPVLRTLDLSGAYLTPMQANALRQLDYGPSIKIGLQFKTAWWTTGIDKTGKQLNIIGGQTYTDRILRTVVYPSFGDVKQGNTTTLIASYCWTEDSERLSALIENDKERLIKMTLQQLAEIHDVDFDFLRRDLLDSMAFSWPQDVNTMGGYYFILFDKLEFRNLIS